MSAREELQACEGELRFMRPDGRTRRPSTPKPPLSTRSDVFAALYAPSLPAAALVDVARAFTPRFEQIGSVVLLDASGLSRLFGSAQELGEHLRDALSKQSPGDTNPRVSIASTQRSEEHTSELQSQSNLVCRLLLEKKKKKQNHA